MKYNFLKDILTLPKASTASFGTNSIAFRGSILWNSTPDVIKNSNMVSVFWQKHKKWTGEGCNCSICKKCCCKLVEVSWYLLVRTF